MTGEHFYFLLFHYIIIMAKIIHDNNIIPVSKEHLQKKKKAVFF